MVRRPATSRPRRPLSDRRMVLQAGARAGLRERGECWVCRRKRATRFLFRTRVKRAGASRRAIGRLLWHCHSCEDGRPLHSGWHR